MFSLYRPSTKMLASFLAQQREQSFTYTDAGASRDSQVPAGFVNDHNRVYLGAGEAVFKAACEAIRRWQMFPREWTTIYPINASISQNTIVAMTARCYGGWWTNACRIVYVIDEMQPVRRFGFAYGTLPDHVECGEERFSIEWHTHDDSVWYDLWAFSRPRHPLVRLAYPLARNLQRRFARESLAAMKEAVKAAEFSTTVAG